MSNIQEVLKNIMNILRDEAWSGIAGAIVLVAMLSFFIAFLYTRRLHPNATLILQNTDVFPGKIRNQNDRRILSKIFLMVSIGASGWFSLIPLLLSIARGLEALAWLALAIPFFVSILSFGFFNDVIGGDRRALVQLPLTFFIAPSLLVFVLILGLGTFIFGADIPFTTTFAILFSSLAALTLGFTFATSSMFGVLFGFMIREIWRRKER